MTVAIQNRRVIASKWLPFPTAKRHVTNVKKYRENACITGGCKVKPEINLQIVA